MKIQTRLNAIMELLAGEYPDRQVLIHYTNPFELTVAVALSAQMTDAAVNKVTPKLFELWPDPVALAAADLNQLEEVIHSLGFYHQKAKNLIASAKILVKNFNGSIPQSMEDLTSLPGIGRKCANVIRCQIWDLPGIIVDTHFGRVCRRLGLTDSKNPEKVEKQLASLVPFKRQKEFSMTANYHGRTYCMARKPNCEECPLKQLCPKLLT